MELNPVKIIIWCGGAPNQKALACKLASKFNITGIVIDEHKTVSTKKKPGSFFKKLINRIRFRVIYDSWKNLMKWYAGKFQEWPKVPILRVGSINEQEAYEFTNKKQPDLIVVSGTGLVREKMLSIKPKIGIINLHTGLSPYVKGGPNCTNWCIANNEWHFVGNTIMWMNAGIDSGNIITTETIDIRKAMSLNQAHRMVMEHAHDLYIRAIEYLLQAVAPFQSVPQKEFAKGKLYLTRLWTPEKQKELLKNWKLRSSAKLSGDIKTIALPNSFINFN